MNLVDDIADGRIVHVRNRIPFESFVDVLFLLLFEKGVGDVMVQFLIAVIDDELFEAVGRQVLEAINIQQTQYSPLAVLLHLRNVTKYHLHNF